MLVHLWVCVLVSTRVSVGVGVFVRGQVCGHVGLWVWVCGCAFVGVRVCV